MANYAFPTNKKSADFDQAEAALGDKLQVFKSSKFNPDAYFMAKCSAMTEKEVKMMCFTLNELKKASAEEMRKCVYANYASFIRHFAKKLGFRLHSDKHETAKEISALEGQLFTLRNLLSSQAALVHGLSDGAHIDSLTTGDTSKENTKKDPKNTELSKRDSWYVAYLDKLEVLLSERSADEVLKALDEGEAMAKDAAETKKLNPTALSHLKDSIAEKRQRLADQLAEAASQPSTRVVELRQAVKSLRRLGDGPRAHALLLNSHQQRLQRNMQHIRSNFAQGGSSTPLARIVFTTIAQAINDSFAVFSDEPAYTSELVTWAVKQTETFALLLKRHVLAPSAAAGGIRVAAECVQASLGHCALLEARGLALSPILLRHFKPCVEQALTENLKRIEHSSAAIAAADDWMLTAVRLGSASASLGGSGGSQPKLSSSAHRFNSMVQELFEDVGPLEILNLESQTLDGVFQAFTSYINLLINAMPGSIEDAENLDGNVGHRIVKMAETETQQIALLANASLLADELLPRAALRRGASPGKASDPQNRVPEQKDWKRKLQRLVERLRDSFCRQHALELIFNEDGDVRITADVYISMEANADPPEWFPSPIFQEFYEKLTRMAIIATDMFAGRERFATVLLMRLAETVILWLSNDQTFWEQLHAPTPLGPIGLQQFYLDMQFVTLFTSQGRYLSRNLQQVLKDVIGRAIEVVSGTGVDPYSILPGDDWFIEISQIAVKMVAERANFEFGEPPSPSASANTQFSYD